MSQLDVGWRRFGQIDAALSSDTHYDFNGNRGSAYTFVLELVGSSHSPVSAGRNYVYDPNVWFDIYAPPGSITFATYHGYYATVTQPEDPWQIYMTHPDNPYVNLYYTTASGHLPRILLSNGTPWGGGYACFTPGGEIRRTIAAFYEALTGNPHTVIITDPVILNAYVFVSQTTGDYYGGGLAIPGLSSPGFVALGADTWYGPNVGPAWVGYDLWLTQHDIAMYGHVASDGTTGDVTEGWMTEALVASGGNQLLFALSGKAGRGTVTAFNRDGRVLTPGIDWEFADATGKTLRLLNPSVGSIIVASYLNMAQRIQRGARTVRLSQSNTFHDRRRFSDIRGL